MTNKPEVVAWRWRKPVVNDQGETVGATAWELNDTPGFLPWWTNDPLIRLSDYEVLQAVCEEELFQVRQDRDTHFGALMQALEQVDALKAECEKLRALLSQSAPIVHAHAEASHLLEGFRPKRNQWDDLAEAIDAALHEERNP